MKHSSRSDSNLLSVSMPSSKWLLTRVAEAKLFEVPKPTSDTGKVWPLQVGGQRGWCLCSAGRGPKRLFKIKRRKSPTVNIGSGQCHRLWRAKVTLTLSATAALVEPTGGAGANEGPHTWFTVTVTRTIRHFLLMFR